MTNTRYAKIRNDADKQALAHFIYLLKMPKFNLKSNREKLGKMVVL
ncbi:hypothetical protein [Mastigocoleus testarum]|nr:hypothetical protein [Mastigocoleus testarum]